MKLTREDLAMMLDALNDKEADYIEVYPHYDDYLGYLVDIDFVLVGKKNNIKHIEYMLTID